jgi:hypothetical protein
MAVKYRWIEVTMVYLLDNRLIYKRGGFLYGIYFETFELILSTYFEKTK